MLKFRNKILLFPAGNGQYSEMKFGLV